LIGQSFLAQKTPPVLNQKSGPFVHIQSLAVQSIDLAFDNHTSQLLYLSFSLTILISRWKIKDTTTEAF
jgi:hypothetical protein